MRTTRSLFAAVAASLLVPAFALAGTTTIPASTVVITPGASSVRGPSRVIVQNCPSGRTLAVVGLIGLLLVMFAVGTQVVAIERIGIRNLHTQRMRVWARRFLGSAALAAAFLGTALEFIGHHMPAVVIVGVQLAGLGALCLWFLGFGRAANVLPFTPGEPRDRRNRRLLWNSIFTAGSVVFGLAGLAMVFGGGVNWIWG